MDHVVYLDAKALELEKFFDGSKRMLIRGAAGRKIPYGRVNADDILYFVKNNGEGVIKARAIVKSVLNSEKMTPSESEKLVADYQNKLNLTDSQTKRWAGKRYLIMIEIYKLEKVKEFSIDKSNYSNMDDWLLVEKIENVKIS